MSIIQDIKIGGSFDKALAKAKAEGIPVLYSAVQKVSHVNPLSFYSKGISLYNGERFFWKDKENNTKIAGLGSTYMLRNDSEDSRYTSIENEWKRLISNAVIESDREIGGTGPLLFGGFSFDPSVPRSKEWSDFSHGIFQMPTFMLTVTGQECYLTTNILCTSQDDEGLLNIMEKKQEELLGQKSAGTSNLKLVETTEIAPEEWKEALGEVVSQLKNGDMEKVVLARKMLMSFKDRPLSDEVIQNLWNEQQDSFIFSLEVANSCFLGASPERLVKKAGEDILSTCLAGSIARGGNPEEDYKLGESLLQDDKNLYEHNLVVDMIREVLKQYCSEIDMPDKPELMKVRDIQHLYTPVKGKAYQETSILNVIAQLHPTPALGGVPREKAMKTIKHAEKMDRGLYAAPVGWMDSYGNGEFAVAIRSGLIHKDEAYLFSGCGVVADSTAESEYRETQIKFKPMFRALGGNTDGL
ncbi:isochorismate synthase [Rossellomorea vietnamensis]|uniref:isochorismate synthase n=1 Tax=Rossellomorea vietnamensis TaxID=218284 RepID=A0A5D4K9V0_9BACI|nr:isochorismate synthase [Rossellomorea vietnamensis]TYR72843.1 isochorismate synthase [Rossellomorea vietnamensis]